MYLIVGLGNPGKEYAGTRHNVGFDTIDYLAKKNNVTINKMKFNAVYGEYKLNNEKIILFKPLTYMNLSGNAIKQIINYYKISLDKLIVIYDDIDISLGSLRIRPHGSSGTHNGMKSIIYQLQSDKFKRIRIGIGRNTNSDMSLADFVLHKFSKDERQFIDETIENASLASEEIICSGLNMAMGKYNIIK